jgi:hypothetical protein
MLTIKDLSASKELDRAAMNDVRGGSFAEEAVPALPGLFLFSQPIVDNGYHAQAQGQAASVVGGAYGLTNANIDFEQIGVNGQNVGSL